VIMGDTPRDIAYARADLVLDSARDLLNAL
jgi:hypothetical protein